MRVQVKFQGRYHRHDTNTRRKLRDRHELRVIRNDGNAPQHGRCGATGDERHAGLGITAEAGEDEISSHSCR